MTHTALLWRLLVISALWGSGLPLIRYLAAEMPPFALASARGMVAAVAVLGWLWVSGQLAWPPRGHWRHILVIGTLSGWVPNAMMAVALGQIDAGAASMIQAAGPLMVAVLAALFLTEERPGPRARLGLGLGFVGIAAIIGPAALTGGATLRGAGLMLGVALSYSLSTIYLRRMRPEGGAAALALGQQVVSAVVGTTLSAMFEPVGAYDQPPRVWGVMLALGVLGTAVPLTMFMLLVQKVTATKASVIGYLQPVWATLLGVLLLSEWPEPRVLAGGAVVFLGVWLATGRR